MTTASLTSTSSGADALSSADVTFLQAVVLERSAIVLHETKQYLLVSRLDPIVRAEKIGSIADLVTALRRDPRGRLESLVIEAMTTNETSFFRDIHPFTAMADEIIPEILAERGPANGLTIWCGASSSGQEPYSLAIMIADKFPSLISTNRLRIIATDIAPGMVERTRAGRFTQLEVNRGLPVRQLVQFFQQNGNEWVANPEIRKVMDTRVVNLIAPWQAMPKCDIVFLRNVLIYFSVETKRMILERIRREVLRPGGHLFLGSSETTLNIDNAWTRRGVGRSISYNSPTNDATSAAKGTSTMHPALAAASRLTIATPPLPTRLPAPLPKR